AEAAGAVGADEDVAADLGGHAVGVGEGEGRLVRFDAGDRGDLAGEPDVAAVALPGGGQVDEDLVLGVEGDGGVHEVAEVKRVGFAVEAQVDPGVFVALGQDPAVDAGIGEQLHRAGLEDAGAVRVADGLVVAGFDDDVLDAGLGQQVGEQQAGRAPADDAHPGSQDGGGSGGHACSFAAWGPGGPVAGGSG